MAITLLDLMEELLESIEQRDAGDPDAPAWEACARIERLEAELSRRLAAGEQMPDAIPVGIQVRRRGGVLAGV